MSDTTHNRAEVLTDEQILAMAETALIGVHDKGRLETHVMRGTDIAHCVIGFARALLSQAAESAQQAPSTRTEQQPWQFIRATLNLLIEQHKHGAGMFPQAAEEHREDIAAIRKVLSDIDYYESRIELDAPAPSASEPDYTAEQMQDYARAAQAAPSVPDGWNEVIEALEFYAGGHHFTLHDPSAWDTVSGEPMNFQEDEACTATVEDGSVAKMALEKFAAAPSAPAQEGGRQP